MQNIVDTVHEEKTGWSQRQKAGSQVSTRLLPPRSLSLNQTLTQTSLPSPCLLILGLNPFASWQVYSQLNTSSALNLAAILWHIHSMQSECSITQVRSALMDCDDERRETVRHLEK
jgi:hypothetical protein